ncbi:MAG TPA: DUF4430 domain-containing protein [Elusimicrobia bacterium]|nr:DUF4430 domain-containing protein [Elusimicrobiota bacterium]
MAAAGAVLMKRIYTHIRINTVAAFLFCGSSGAASISVIGPCSEKPVFEREFKVAGSSASAGEISAGIFKENGLPYTGDADGFTSIMGSPSGAQAIEFVSAGKMRFYGWCFSVNGVLPAVMPGSFYLKNDADRLTWFYAFTTYENGVWIDSCVPSYTVRAPQFCGPGLTAARNKDLSVWRPSITFGCPAFETLAGMGN